MENEAKIEAVTTTEAKLIFDYTETLLVLESTYEPSAEPGVLKPAAKKEVASLTVARSEDGRFRIVARGTALIAETGRHTLERNASIEIELGSTEELKSAAVFFRRVAERLE